MSDLNSLLGSVGTPLTRIEVRGVPFEGVVSSESEPKHRIASGLCRDKVEYQ